MHFTSSARRTAGGRRTRARRRPGAASLPARQRRAASPARAPRTRPADAPAWPADPLGHQQPPALRLPDRLRPRRSASRRRTPHHHGARSSQAPLRLVPRSPSRTRHRCLERTYEAQRDMRSRMRTQNSCLNGKQEESHASPAAVAVSSLRLAWAVRGACGTRRARMAGHLYGAAGSGAAHDTAAGSTRTACPCSSKASACAVPVQSHAWPGSQAAGSASSLRAAPSVGGARGQRAVPAARSCMPLRLNALAPIMAGGRMRRSITRPAALPAPRCRGGQVALRAARPARRAGRDGGGACGRAAPLAQRRHGVPAQVDALRGVDRRDALGDERVPQRRAIRQAPDLRERPPERLVLRAASTPLVRATAVLVQCLFQQHASQDSWHPAVAPGALGGRQHQRRPQSMLRTRARRGVTHKACS